MIEKKEIDAIFEKLGINDIPNQDFFGYLNEFVNAWSFYTQVGTSVNESFSVESKNLLQQIEL